MSALEVCKYCETELESEEMNLDNYCCDGKHAELLELENERLKEAVKEAEDAIKEAASCVLEPYKDGFIPNHFKCHLWLSKYGAKDETN